MCVKLEENAIKVASEVYTIVYNKKIILRGLFYCSDVARKYVMTKNGKYQFKLSILNKDMVVK